MATMNDNRRCGECSLCCKLPSIVALRKPIDTWCQHCRPAKEGGCTIYADRPFACRVFECGWLNPQQWDVPSLTGLLPPLTEEWFPARCHFYLSLDDMGCPLVTVDPDYPDAWRQEPYYSTFLAIARHEFEPGATVPISFRIGLKNIWFDPGGVEEVKVRSRRQADQEFRKRCFAEDRR